MSGPAVERAGAGRRHHYVAHQMLMMNQETDLQNAHEIQKSWKSAHENEPVETQRSRIFDFFGWFAHVKEASKQPAASQARRVMNKINTVKKKMRGHFYI